MLVPLMRQHAEAPLASNALLELRHHLLWARPGSRCLQLLPEEPFTTPAVAGKSQRQHTSCYNKFLVGLFLRKFHVPAGAMAVLLHNCGPCAKITSETAAQDTVSPKMCSGGALGPRTVRQHAFTAAETVQQEQCTLTVAASSHLYRASNVAAAGVPAAGVEAAWLQAGTAV